LNGAFHANVDFVQGIAKMTGLKPVKNPEKISAETEFVFFYFGNGAESLSGLDLKSKIKRIEEFDVFLGSVLKMHEKTAGLRVGVAGILPEALTKKTHTRNPALVLTAGEGIASEKNAVFSEKLAGQSASAAEKGHEFLSIFLKK